MQTFGVLDGRAKTLATATPKESDSRDREAGFSFSSWDWLAERSRAGSSWKTSLAFCRPTRGKTLSQLSTKSKRAGIWGAGQRLTLSTSACRRIVKGLSLWQVLERTVPIRSLLTAANCAGIIRREERNGREVPPVMRKALDETIRLCSSAGAVSDTPEEVIFAPRYVPSQESIREAIQTGPYYVARNLTWTEWERLMGFPDDWTVVEAD